MKKEQLIKIIRESITEELQESKKAALKKQLKSLIEEVLSEQEPAQEGLGTKIKGIFNPRGQLEAESWYDSWLSKNLEKLGGEKFSGRYTFDKIKDSFKNKEKEIILGADEGAANIFIIGNWFGYRVEPVQGSSGKKIKLSRIGDGRNKTEVKKDALQRFLRYLGDDVERTKRDAEDAAYQKKRDAESAERERRQAQYDRDREYRRDQDAYSAQSRADAEKQQSDRDERDRESRETQRRRDNPGWANVNYR